MCEFITYTMETKAFRQLIEGTLYAYDGVYIPDEEVLDTLDQDEQYGEWKKLEDCRKLL